ncbi:Spo0E family sporulation regulatory protein-aspartic acid phosphatase [Paenibacillus roseipurpureus]|uniref:Spo0E family sporulation regulatory protein-aspartic acid phosphatase n=1 Tax=Paenibacillus roseopurpureus TaxID=2918901 RepID=UPI0037C522CC
METILQAKINLLRCQMVEQASIYGSFTNESVVKISQLLDRYIVVYQRLILQRAKLKLIS